MKAADIRKAMHDGTVLAYQPSHRHYPKPVVVVGEGRSSTWEAQYTTTNERVYASHGWHYIPSRSLIGPYDEVIEEWKAERARKAEEREQEEARRIVRRARANEVIQRLVTVVPGLTWEDVNLSYDGIRITFDIPEEDN